MLPLDSVEKFRGWKSPLLSLSRRWCYSGSYLPPCIWEQLAGMRDGRGAWGGLSQGCLPLSLSGSSDKEFTCKSGDVRDVVLFPKLGLSPEGGHGNPLLYSCLESPMDRGVCSAIVHSVTKSGTRLKQLNTHALSLIIRESLVLSVRHFQFCVTLHLPKSIPPI